MDWRDDLYFQDLAARCHARLLLKKCPEKYSGWPQVMRGEIKKYKDMCRMYGFKPYSHPGMRSDKYLTFKSEERE